MKIFKKKRFLFPLIFLGGLVAATVISNIFELETSNSALGTVYSFFLGFTLIWFLLRTIKDHKTKLINIKIPFLKISLIWVVYFLLAHIILAVGLLPVFIVFAGD